ncbi:GIY-YIG nuclease family protein [Agrobacterium tumefaciens]|uniref:GIY-YIG nuclease family protein n=1 Tax=Agrobacterium tumefaciens TaxID=358 RepID=UPI00287E4325|nr:GIY-YIG nuclease family protein [Agrobacterium tumefaciens]MDS7594921.1 GIY-YIG nuclease family protein [Agrobacterium tumefaciens]
MVVYFFTELEDKADPPSVKIGFSNNVERRRAELQTGNPRTIALMGQIKSEGEREDRTIESDLHRLFADRRGENGEWFEIFPEDVITALHRYSSRAYLTVGDNPFEIVSYDCKGIPEFASPWRWADVNPQEFCPACGWACRWTYSENWGCDYCMECGANEIDYEDTNVNVSDRIEE